MDGPEKAQMTATLNFQLNLNRVSVSAVDDFDRLPYLRGKSRYSDPGSTATGATANRHPLCASSGCSACWYLAPVRKDGLAR